RFTYNTYACPPIAIAYLAGSALAAGHDVQVVDAVGEAPTRYTALEDPKFMARGLTVDEIVAAVRPDSEVLAVTCMFSQDWPFQKRVLGALRARFPRIPIVAGGEHVTALPELVLADGEVDHCVLGEGEETFVDLLDALHAGRSPADVPGMLTRVGG